MGVASLTDHAPFSSLGVASPTYWQRPFIKFGHVSIYLLTTPLFQVWLGVASPTHWLYLIADHAPFSRLGVSSLIRQPLSFFSEEKKMKKPGNHREIITCGIFLFYFSNIQKTQNAIPLLLWEKNYYCLNIPSEPDKLVHTVPSGPEMLVHTVA